MEYLLSLEHLMQPLFWRANKRALNRKVDKWVWTPFKNPARIDELKLSHWQKTKNLEEPYPFAKINHKVKLVAFSDEEYNKLLKNLHQNWTKDETLYLWDMWNLYDLNFIVIHDRYDRKYDRTVEELKDRYSERRKKLDISQKSWTSTQKKVGNFPKKVGHQPKKKLDIIKICKSLYIKNRTVKWCHDDVIFLFDF